MKNSKLALFGVGNLGKRYMQAIAKIENVELVVFDVSESVLEEIPLFLDKNYCSSLNYKISLYQEVLDFIDPDTIVISASTAKDRISQLLDVINRNPRGLIIEKPVVQRSDDYKLILDSLKGKNIISFVDFTLRMQPFYRTLKMALSQVKSGSYSVHLPRMGLMCVGIHHIDIFKWLFDIDKIEVVSSFFESVYEQKRQGYFDVTGSLTLKSGDLYATIINSRNEDVRSVQIITQDKVFSLNEDQRWLSTLDVTNKTIINEKIEYSFVSQYMSDLIKKMIDGRYDEIDLPSIVESFDSHQMVFDFLETYNHENLNFT